MSNCHHVAAFLWYTHTPSHHTETSHLLHCCWEKFFEVEAEYQQRSHSDQADHFSCKLQVTSLPIDISTTFVILSMVVGNSVSHCFSLSETKTCWVCVWCLLCFFFSKMNFTVGWIKVTCYILWKTPKKKTHTWNYCFWSCDLLQCRNLHRRPTHVVKNLSLCLFLCYIKGSLLCKTNFETSK